MACIVIIVSSVCIVIASWYGINKKSKKKKTFLVHSINR